MNAFESMLLKSKKIVPVVTIPELDMAIPVADTLDSCGFNTIEITLRSECATDAIALIAKQRPNINVGAGTVKNSAQLISVVSAGARFIVSPGLDLAMVEAAAQAGVPLVPGIMTATELMQAENSGLRVVKLFPAVIAGGIDFINAMQAVFPVMKFFPTGGIGEDTVNDFLACSNVICVGGSWLTPRKILQQRDWAKLHEIVSRC